ncbi:MAG: MATE family efflux transporter [Planctomycetota bacterium]|nr:MAG: MATE family efflux transporter [Planctomycetota bacterium]
MSHPLPTVGPNRLRSARTEACALVALAWPVAVAQVGGLCMGLVDTWMVGRLGAIELAAVALGDACYFTLHVFAMGLILALQPLISQAYGAGDAARCGATWRCGLRLALLLALPLALLVSRGIPWALARAELDPFVVRTAADYLAPRALGILPHLLFVAHRAFFNALGSTRPAMAVTLLALVANAVLDWALIFGRWGLPALGVAGSGLATALCNVLMLAGLSWWIARPRYRPYLAGGGASLALLGRVVRLGLPIGLSHMLEVGAFAATSTFMGWLGIAALASHQIALKMASTSFMLAIALGTATSIRVGNAIGAGQTRAAQRATWTGLGLGTAGMGCAAVVFLVAGKPIVSCFTADAEVVALGTRLLAVAAAFQLSDGIQGIAAGALRGAGDTTSPFVAQLVGHWAVGVPAAYLLAFVCEGGPLAVWWALAGGLTVTALLLLGWARRIASARALD